MSRGNQRRAIFRNTRDYESFLETLGEACERTGWRVHAYVLMGNHYHILLETPDPNLVAGMRWLQGTYTQRFNARHGLSGHVLQGRYKALPVEAAEGTLMTISDYIHLNPARAKRLLDDRGVLADYPWSSYPLYLKPAKRPDWLEVNDVLAGRGLADTASGRARYRKDVQRRMQEIMNPQSAKEVNEDWKPLRRGWYIGSEAFRDKLLDRLDQLKGDRESYSGSAMKRHDEERAARLVEGALTQLNLTEADLETLKKGATEKCLIAWLVRKHTSVPNGWIARRLKMGRVDCFSRYPNRIERSDDREVQKKKKQLDNITRIRD
jgi:putative transposase